MVRASSLPLRLSALDYGADVVYSEEIPAHRAGHATCLRMVNPVLGTVDFIEQKTSSNVPLVLFRTHVERECEPKRCVLQLGASDAVTALKAARLFERDVAAIDINMGCSKHYSVSRGMGSALMTKPVVAEDIIKTLRRNLSIPVSVKTRLQSTGCSDSLCQVGVTSDRSDYTGAHSNKVDTAGTLEWIQWLQSAGAHAVTVHMRTPTEKNRDAAHYDMFGVLHQAMRRTNTPLVYNGDVWDRTDMLRIHNCVNSSYSANSEDCAPSFGVPIMVCRAGLWNPAIFAQLRAPTSQTTNAAVPVADLLSSILRHSAATANCPLNTRYLLQQILAGAKQLSSPVRSEILNRFSLRELSVGLHDAEYVTLESERQTREWEKYCQKSGEPTLSRHDGSNSNRNESSCEEKILPYSEISKTDNDHAQQRQIVASAAASVRCVQDEVQLAAAPDVWSRFFNCVDWPGVTSKTSHEYNDRYFDDNYYVAFNKPVSTALQAAKRPFAYAGFTESSSTVVRTKRSAV